MPLLHSWGKSSCQIFSFSSSSSRSCKGPVGARSPDSQPAQVRHETRMRFAAFACDKPSLTRSFRSLAGQSTVCLRFFAMRPSYCSCFRTSSVLGILFLMRTRLSLKQRQSQLRPLGVQRNPRLMLRILLQTSEMRLATSRTPAARSLPASHAALAAGLHQPTAFRTGDVHADPLRLQ